MAVISVNYNEGSNEPDLGYKSVAIKPSGYDVEILFDTGDFVQDWFNATKYGMLNEFMYVSMSSSVDHFIMDGGNELYDSMYLVLDEETKTFELTEEYNESGYEFFVPKGKRFTWDELKDAYND